MCEGGGQREDGFSDAPCRRVIRWEMKNLKLSGKERVLVWEIDTIIIGYYEEQREDGVSDAPYRGYYCWETKHLKLWREGWIFVVLRTIN